MAMAMGALASGCATWQMIRAPHLDLCPGPLVSTERIAGDFTARYSAGIAAKSIDDLALSLVLQKRGDRLLLVAFGVSPPIFHGGLFTLLSAVTLACPGKALTQIR